LMKSLNVESMQSSGISQSDLCKYVEHVSFFTTGRYVSKICFFRKRYCLSDVDLNNLSQSSRDNSTNLLYIPL
jgi:hypothetical protein